MQHPRSEPVAARRRPPLLIADGDIPTTHLLARVLRQAHGDVEIRYPDTIFGADVRSRVVVISRLCLPSHGWLPDYLSAHGIRYVYFLDDNFWVLTPDVDPHLAAFFGHPAVVATLDALVTGAAAVVVMSRRLGNAIADRHPAVPVAYLNPPFDIASAQAAFARTSLPPADRPVRIGYPTSRRLAVVQLLVPVVRTIAARYAGRVAFEFVGWMPDELAGVPGVEWFPHIADYDSYIAFKISRQWDIGLAPLRGGTFDACKTSVKYREYGGCRVAGVYSDVPPYTDDVVDGVTGLCVPYEAEAWIGALERLIESSSLRESIVERAHEDVRQRFSQDVSARRWREIVSQCELPTPIPA